MRLLVGLRVTPVPLVAEKILLGMYDAHQAAVHLKVPALSIVQMKRKVTALMAKGVTLEILVQNALVVMTGLVKKNQMLKDPAIAIMNVVKEKT